MPQAAKNLMDDKHLFIVVNAIAADDLAQYKGPGHQQQ